MASNYISIAEAAEISGKSPQTIRRLIKGKKIKFKKMKTPQGFNYEIEQTSLCEYYDISVSAAAVPSVNSEEKVTSQPAASSAPAVKDEAATIQELLDNRSHKVLVEYAPVKEFNNTLQVLLKQHAKEKENLFKLVEAFQNKVVTLETKLKAEEDSKKSWYKFW